MLSYLVNTNIEQEQQAGQEPKKVVAYGEPSTVDVCTKIFGCQTPYLFID
jgi:hypothetical protein